MKVLFVATVRSHIGHFHMPFIRKLKELGHTVDAAFKDNSDEKPGLDLSGIDNIFEVPFSRSPYSAENIKAYKILKSIIDSNGYDAIHCHTPMGSVVARLAATDARENGTKVIYTAHGFHFYDGASKKNWMLYYPVEKRLSKNADCLITINDEDFNRAKNEFYSKNVYKVNGVGVDYSEFVPVDQSEKNELRAEYGYSDNDFIMIYPANINYEKNQKMLFDSVKLLKDGGTEVKLLCPGKPERVEEFRKTVSDMGIADNVDFLGFRRDINKLDALSDISVSSSLREGLPVNLIEAMSVGNPIIATDVRGNRDLVRDGVNGFLVPVDDYKTLAKRIKTLVNDNNLMKKFRINNLEMVKNYSTEYVNDQLLEIYKSLELID